MENALRKNISFRFARSIRLSIQTEGKELSFKREMYPFEMDHEIEANQVRSIYEETLSIKFDTTNLNGASNRIGLTVQ